MLDYFALKREQPLLTLFLNITYSIILQAQGGRESKQPRGDGHQEEEAGVREE